MAIQSLRSVYGGSVQWRLSAMEAQCCVGSVQWRVDVRCGGCRIEAQNWVRRLTGHSSIRDLELYIQGFWLVGQSIVPLRMQTELSRRWHIFMRPCCNKSRHFHFFHLKHFFRMSSNRINQETSNVNTIASCMGVRLLLNIFHVMKLIVFYIFFWVFYIK